MVKQLWYLMYHDNNKYIVNQTCEFCNEQLGYLEKIIFPPSCKNNPANPDFDDGRPVFKIASGLSGVEAADSKSPDLHRESSGDAMLKMSNLTQSRRKNPQLRKDFERPHFYHVICMDLIWESLKK